MATDSKKKLESSKAKTDHLGSGPGAKAEQTKAVEPTFTPEQRQILGEVYRLILSWRREQKMATALASSDGDSDMLPATSSQPAPVEVEA
jgi:hypothetical protein